MIGTILRKKYKILEKIGEGGMACVYKALDIDLDRIVAIKFVHANLATNKDIRQRFLKEGKTVASLDHQNILKIFDSSGISSEELYVVTEFVSGKTLKQLINEKSRIHEVISIMIAREIIIGLQKASSFGVVHRDIKPDNIMISDEGFVKIMDFGIAKDIFAVGHTYTKALIGSPPYMSPEQITGKVLDSRTDMYSLGILLYEAILGRLPFSGKTIHEVIMNVMQSTLESPRSIDANIDPEIEKLILRCINRDIDKRYPNFLELLNHIDSILIKYRIRDARQELRIYFISSSTADFEQKWNNQNMPTVVATQSKSQINKLDISSTIKSIITEEKYETTIIEQQTDQPAVTPVRKHSPTPSTKPSTTPSRKPLATPTPKATATQPPQTIDTSYTKQRTPQRVFTTSYKKQSSISNNIFSIFMGVAFILILIFIGQFILKQVDIKKLLQISPQVKSKPSKHYSDEEQPGKEESSRIDETRIYKDDETVPYEETDEHYEYEEIGPTKDILEKQRITSPKEVIKKKTKKDISHPKKSDRKKSLSRKKIDKKKSSKTKKPYQKRKTKTPSSIQPYYSPKKKYNYKQKDKQTAKLREREYIITVTFKPPPGEVFINGRSHGLIEGIKSGKKYYKLKKGNYKIWIMKGGRKVDEARVVLPRDNGKIINLKWRK